MEAWLHRVPPADHARTSPFADKPDQLPDAASAGAQIFHNECAKCHGNDAMGKASRPALVSDRIAHATDGDLFWMVTNGNPWKGMPPWGMLPAKQRWQVVAYLRALNAADLTPSTTQPQGDSR